MLRTGLLALLFSVGVSAAPGRGGVLVMPLHGGAAHAAHGAHHEEPSGPNKTPAHPHGPLCVLCVVGASLGALYVALVYTVQGSLLTRRTAPARAELAVRLGHRSRAPPIDREPAVQH